MKEERNILLETGTNELELLEFTISEDVDDTKTVHIGLNVAKVREIIKRVDVRHLPNTHDAIQGVFELRGFNIQALDVKRYLYGIPTSSKNSFFIIMEFSRQKIAIVVREVLRIRRVQWNEIKSFESVVDKSGLQIQNNVTGLFHDGTRHIHIIDIEKIVADVSGKEILNTDDTDSAENRVSGRVMTAEDSGFLRKRITSELEKKGFDVIPHIDGQRAWDYLVSELEKSSPVLPDIIITDVEMPEMDGYTLTKKVKEHPELSHIPVIIFSSLITEDVIHKGVSVGADRQLSKPDLNILIDMIKEFL